MPPHEAADLARGGAKASLWGVPDVNNLILLDKLYILSYVFVVMTMAVIVKNSWVDATGDIRVATRADRRGLVLLTAGCFASAALILVLNLA